MQANKQDPVTAHFPIVLISANSGLEDMAATSLADGYLDKPFDVDQLIEIARRFCN